MLPAMLKKKFESTSLSTQQDKSINKRKHNENDSSVKQPKHIGKKVKVSHSSSKKQNSTTTFSDAETIDDTINALEIHTILNQIKIDNNNTDWLKKTDIDIWINEFLDNITNLPIEKQKIYATSKWIDKEIVVPMKKKHLDNIPNYSTINFVPPKQVHIIGSFNLDTLLNENSEDVGVEDSENLESIIDSKKCPIIDLCVVMPPTYFTKDDYLNMIYFTKKSVFLSHLVMKLKLSQRTSDTYSFCFYDNNELCPMLKIETLISNIPVIIRVQLTSETIIFKQNKLLPDKCNINGNILNGNDDEINNTPSAHYNNLIMSDLVLVSNEEKLKNTLYGLVSVKNAIILFKQWLYTLGIYGDNLNGYIVSMYAAYLLKKKKLHLSMTVFEILKVFWTNLAISNWHLPNGGISLCDNKTTNNLEIFHQYFDVVFLDFQGNYNLCGNLSLDLYLRLKYECNRTLKSLHPINKNSFAQLFLTVNIPKYMQYDHIFNIPVKGDLLLALKVSEFEQLLYDFCGQWYKGYIFSIAKTLRKGFGNRIHAMTQIQPSKKYSWSINKKYTTDKLNLKFGLILNCDYALEILDKGPQADQYEAIDFRKFWGSKSELRRFQDGTITESCIWEKLHSSMSQKRVICKQIALHLLNHHFGFLSTDIVYMANEFDCAYRVCDAVVDNKTFENIPTNSESLSLAVIKSFDELGKQLRQLENIPLDISAILGTSPVFRYCEVNPIMPQANVEIVDGLKMFHSYAINEGIIQFALSSKWPNDLAAIQRIKGAFYVKIVKSLNTQFQLQTRFIGNGIEVIKDGYMFRLKIVTPKELMVMKKTKTSKGVTKYVDTMDSLKFHMNMILLPKLTSNLHSLYHKHSSFGPAVLIAKRWLSAQLLDSTLWPEECTEIIMAHIYKENSFFNIPTQPQVAFFRFLQLLGTTDWHREMIFLNFDDNLPEQEIEKLEKRFDSQRQLFPDVCICTMFENKELSIWSKSSPTIEIATRASIISYNAIQSLENDIHANNQINENVFFSPTFSGYDVLIKLKTTAIQSSNLHDFSKDIGKNKFIDESVPAADFNLAQIFLQDLRKNYDDFAIFFYDSYGGDVITVLWKPIVHSAIDFSAFHIYGRKRSKSLSRTKQYECNTKQFIEDFLVMGKGLVLSITETEL